MRNERRARQWRKDYYLLHKEKQLSYVTEYNKKHKQRLHSAALIYARKTYKDRVMYILEYLSTHPCVDCGESDPIVLQFDHVRSKKNFDISVGIKNRVGLSTLQREIKKCDVRCANCHMRKHSGKKLELWALRRMKNAA